MAEYVPVTKKTLADLNRENRARYNDSKSVKDQPPAYQSGTYTKAELKRKYDQILQELNGNITEAKRQELEETLEEIESRL